MIKRDYKRQSKRLKNEIHRYTKLYPSIQKMFLTPLYQKPQLNTEITFSIVSFYFRKKYDKVIMKQVLAQLM